MLVVLVRKHYGFVRVRSLAGQLGLGSGCCWLSGAWIAWLGKDALHFNSLGDAAAVSTA